MATEYFTLYLQIIFVAVLDHNIGADTAVEIDS